MNEMPIGTANAMASLLSGVGPMNFNSSLQEHIHKASGIDGMNNFPTKPSSETVIFEESSDIFCVKTTDANNATTSCRYFAFQEISKEEAMKEISPYLMKGELDHLKDDIISAVRGEIGAFKEEILNAKQPVRSFQQTRFDSNKSSGTAAQEST